jgi:uncharacterized protein (DUF1778 family)
MRSVAHSNLMRMPMDFVVVIAHHAAMRAIEKIETIRLNAEESRAFAEALVHPREPGPRLKAAVQRYLKTLGR